ncbi:cytochrome P450 71A1-like [Dioscorea cayenensis subsp. rotundata]|uniref:Cytochrome P450 71A1-like n=1 Tax=Dioscorea cayennensis subsp. rotundata TaxID=55577 RepID=A0AB40C9F9_DIOCR|nr:cytochrome P450 71A1-like [Dioscorea cayenensis subsp. rotundata]
MSLIMLLISFLITISFLSKILLHFSKKPNYPPSPPKLPIIGNLHQLGPLPHRSLQTFSKKHGPLMLLQLGQVPLLVASSPSMAKEIMKTQDHLFANRPSIKAATRLLYNGMDIAFSPYGEYWKLVRKFSVYHLLSPTMVSSYKSIREHEVVFMLEKIKKSCCDGKMVHVSEELNYMTMDIISKITLGKSLREWGSWGIKMRRTIGESSK